MASKPALCGRDEQEVLVNTRPIGVRDPKRQAAGVVKGLGEAEGTGEPNDGWKRIAAVEQLCPRRRSGDSVKRRREADPFRMEYPLSTQARETGECGC
jgi:hypothetical protein